MDLMVPCVSRRRPGRQARHPGRWQSRSGCPRVEWRCCGGTVEARPGGTDLVGGIVTENAITQVHRVPAMSHALIVRGLGTRWTVDGRYATRMTNSASSR
jgi:hypothetical protein